MVAERGFPQALPKDFIANAQLGGCGSSLLVFSAVPRKYSETAITAV
jgi:hypothetical protein